MKYILTFVCCNIFNLALVHAANVNCNVAINEERGFSEAFTVQLKPAAVNGQILIKSGATASRIGTITEVTKLDSADRSQARAFKQVLAVIAEPDVSGVSPERIASVTSIVAYKDASSESDTTIFELFAGNKKIGGTFMFNGLGTSCVK